MGRIQVPNCRCLHHAAFNGAMMSGGEEIRLVT